MNSINYKNEIWDLSHLESRSFKYVIDDANKTELNIVIIFSCHCYSHSFRWDEREEEDIPQDEIIITDTESRIFSPERYELSKSLLMEKIETLKITKIIVASEGNNQNFLTFKDPEDAESDEAYLIFFKVERKKRRRIFIYVQSAYKRALTKRERGNRPVNFGVLVKAVFEGRPIRA